MEELPDELQDLVQKQMLHVEEAVLRERNENKKYKCILQEIAVEFAERSPILPLTTSIDYLGKCSNFTGVYLIYYVGETSLYGDLVSPSQVQPIYVGMSKRGFLNRLKDHRKKVAKAKDLEVEDFSIRFIILDIELYAPSIQEMLIMHYNPLWNDPKVKFLFGSANGVNNNWYKYHVTQDELTRREMIKRVKEYYWDRINSAQSDHHTSVNPP